MNNSVVFRLNYLLGVNKTILEKEFPTEFKESEKLRLFENYPDAKMVRSLCRLRQSVLSDFNAYQRKSQDINAFNGVVGITEDIAFLKSNGIDIKDYFKDLSLFRYFNFLGRMLNAILFKVLVELEMPYIDELIQYFYMPIVSKNDLENLASKANDTNNPYKIMIYNGDKIRQSLKYALHKDRSCIYSIFSIQGKSFSGDIKIEPFIFSKEPCEDVDPEAKIDVNEIFKEVKSEMVSPNMKAAKIRGLEEYKAQKISADVEEDSDNEELREDKKVVVKEEGEIEENQGVEVENPVKTTEESVLTQKENVVEVTDAEFATKVNQTSEVEVSAEVEDISVKEEVFAEKEKIISEIIPTTQDYNSLKLHIEKTVELNLNDLTAEQILQESRFDTLTYFILCSIIKIPIYQLMDVKFVKSEIISVLLKSKYYSESEISEYIDKSLNDLKLHFENSKVEISLGHYKMSFC